MSIISKGVIHLVLTLLCAMTLLVALMVIDRYIIPINTMVVVGMLVAVYAVSFWQWSKLAKKHIEKEMRDDGG